MLFSGIPFLCYFLPCTLLLYLIVPRRLKNAALLAASLVFYAWGEPVYIALMAVSITQGYILGRLTERYRGKRRAKLFAAASVTLSLAALGYFKYANFFVSSFASATGLPVKLLNIALPVGISFYTFQLISYIIDISRGGVKAQRNFIDLALYIAMFPQLIAGPIVRYSDIEPQLRGRTHSLEKTALGARRFVLGLAKKILIANQLGELCSAFKASKELSVAFFWIYAAANMLQIYFDFSGYSDMAIGLGRIFGFDFPENFDYPYISASITEFWRRWHMTLGSWFRDYVYIPLGGNRVSKPRWLLNLMIVWMLTGLWHGAAWNFVLWGLYFGVLLILEKLLIKRDGRFAAVRHIYVLFLVLISFVIFDAASLPDIALSLRSMFGFGGLPAVSAETLYCLRSYAVILAVAAFGATPLARNAVAALRRRTVTGRIVDILEPVALAALTLVCVAYLVDGSFNPFLYFRF